LGERSNQSFVVFVRVGDRWIEDEWAIGEIETDAERWGVAIWEDIDPRIDFFTIFVRGLTNSMRWRSREDNKNDNNNPAENENE
jgi:hypothetical protein